MGPKIHFDFHAQITKKGLKGSCRVDDGTADPHRTIRCLDMTELVVSGNTTTIRGNALDGDTPTTYTIQATDNGKPKSGSDTFSITTASGFTARVDR